MYIIKMRLILDEIMNMNKNEEINRLLRIEDEELIN